MPVLQELCWEDRERVLRQLFARINNQHRRPLVPPAGAPAEVDAAPLQGLCTAAGPAGLA